jgi:glycosyltransferase involved in cell wall biosynthesis
VTSHPIQYHAPWFRALSERVDLRVLFAHRLTPAEQADYGFGVAFEWDVPLLEGYSFDWLRNIAHRPGIDHFWGCNTPGIGARLAKLRPDAVIVTGWNLWTYWQAIRAARRAAIPVMVRGDSQLPTRRSALRRMAKQVVYPRLLDAFDACLAVGQRNREYYVHYGVPASRLYFAPHSVDNDFFACAASDARGSSAGGARERLGIPGGAVVFAFAGRLAEFKRPLDFMRALDLAHREHPAVFGLVVGDGALRTAVEDHRRRHATPCAMAGFLNQQRIGAAYASADALVLPSSADETWGLVVNEAMACGIPAIVSDQVGCAPDLVLDGRTGFTYPCGDVEALAARMTRLAGDAALRQAMGTAAAAQIETFSPQATAAGVMRAIDDIRDRRGALRPAQNEEPGALHPAPSRLSHSIRKS